MQTEAVRPTRTVRGEVRRTRLDDRPAWLLLTERTAVLLCSGADGTLLLPYWGAQGHTEQAGDYLPLLPENRPSQRAFKDGFPLAYPTYGDASFKEPCLVVSRGDGAREIRLRFVEDRVHDLDGRPVLVLVLQDELIGLTVEQTFVVFGELDVVARSASVINHGSEALTLERVLSAALPLPPGEYDVWSLHGQWGRECELHRRPILPGKFITESRRGITSHEAHPWFAVRPRAEELEHVGPVWFGSLAWSGNWLGVFERERNDALNIALGIQPFDFSWRLEPGERFVAPELVCGFTDGGPGGASRILHRYDETVQLPESHRDRLRPVLYNSWEATSFNVRADQQLELARKASAMGVELFVIDDGWFGARDHERAGLGDWYVNAAKFPEGLGVLIDQVHLLGMQFGIWVEPEMVNPDSDLYRAHPEWAYHAVGREATFARNQLVLNFARADVVDAIHGQLGRVLREHGTIDFIKWDHNRAWTEVGWPEQPQQQREVWVRHVQGVYDVMSRLRSEFPSLLIESCAGGGGRADLGILRWTDQVWTSDNTEAADRLNIQYGYSRAHTPRAMVNWVTDVPNHQSGRVSPLEFRFHVAMQGVLGVGGDIRRWSEAELEIARDMITTYKGIREIVQHGRQYWLIPPAAIGPCAVEYVSQSGEEAVVLMYQVRGLLGAGVRRTRLYGLHESRRYRRVSDGTESTGAALMGAGVPLDLVARGSGRGADWRSRIDVWRTV